MNLTQVSGNIFLVSLIMGDLGLPTGLQEQQTAFLTQRVMEHWDIFSIQKQFY